MVRKKKKIKDMSEKDWEEWGKDFEKKMENLGDKFEKKFDKKCDKWELKWSNKLGAFNFISPLIGSIFGLIFLT